MLCLLNKEELVVFGGIYFRVRLAQELGAEIEKVQVQFRVDAGKLLPDVVVSEDAVDAPPKVIRELTKTLWAKEIAPRMASWFAALPRCWSATQEQAV